MGEAQFSFKGLLAKTAPEGKQGGLAKRGKYDFAVAYPDPKSLPLDNLMDSLKSALDDEGDDLALYGDQSGYGPLRELVSERLKRDRNIQVDPDGILLGDGSGQPIKLLCEVLLDPGDVVLTEDFVYSGTLNQLRIFQADIRGVECDDQGMLPDVLEHNIKISISQGKQPKFIYTIPTFQNPQGWVMSLERRQEMVRLSHEYGIPILEDDCYVDLRFEGEPVPAIHSLDESGNVMYVASFSKIIAPGMRIGYMAAPKEIVDVALAAKGGGFANQFASWAVHRYSNEYLDDHIDTINDIQRTKRDAMLSALGENLGSSATWSHPPGGLFIWLKMRDDVDLESVRDKILDHADVGYQPGTLFAPDGVSGKNYARLCFGYNSPEEIREGISRLASAFEVEGFLDN